MKKINLKYYYEHIEEDMIVEITDEQYEVYKEFERKDNALERRMYRYNGQYSLDADDGTENEILNHSTTIGELYELKSNNDQLRKALSILPEKQAARIEAHFFLGMSKTEIADIERVDKSAISRSINSGLKILGKYLKNISD
ncbi:MAG: sigma-70 family RNA polymerase sigma factor [Clostridia bacterium]